MAGLMNVPGLRGIIQARAINEQSAQHEQQQQMGQLQQMGVLQGILARQRAEQQDMALRGALSQLGPNATEADIIKAVTPHVGGNALLTTMTGSKDRQAALQAKSMELQNSREARAAEIEQRGEQEIARIREQAAQNRITKEEADAREARMREQIVRITASLRPERAPTDNKPPAGYRWTPDGNQEAIPGGPADQKAQAEAQRKSSGAGDVDVAVASLRDAYDRLEKGGGVTSTEKSSMGNLSASISASGPGQVVGRTFGTRNQSARNDIAMTRPALLAALMKATGMNAKQLDSNAELKLWLTTATDPTLDVQANRRALDNIERKYLGRGGSVAPQQPSGTPALPPGFKPL